MGHWIFDSVSFNYYDEDYDKVFYELIKNYFDEFLIQLNDSDYNGNFAYNTNIFNKLRVDSIILYEMYSNSDKRFIEKFSTEFYKINGSKSVFFCKKLFGNKNFNSYILNLHIILLAHKYNEDNYGNFEKIVEDIANIQIDICTFKDFPNCTQLAKFDEIVKFIVEFNEYKDMPNLRKLFSLILEDIDSSRAWSLVIYYKKVISQMLDDYLTNDIDNDEIFYKVLEDRLGGCLKKYHTSISDSLFSLYFRIEDLYYSRILLYGGRFFYLNGKIREIENIEILRLDIFRRIKDFSVEMFDELNEGSIKDSFITCMDIVFDSDSYLELNNKLTILEEASKLYNEGLVDDAFSLIRDLRNEKHKKRYLGELFSYWNNGMNLVSKPNKITDREKQLYSKIDSSISYDFLGDTHRYSSKVSGISEAIDEAVKKERLPFNRLKNKVKRMKWFGGV